jgi:hypothetical protein
MVCSVSMRLEMAPFCCWQADAVDFLNSVLNLALLLSLCAGGLPLLLSFSPGGLPLFHCC